MSIQSRTESKLIYEAKNVTYEVRAGIVIFGSHCYKHGERSAGGRNDSKSTIPAWDATYLSQFKRSGELYCRNMHPQLLTYLT